MENITLDMHCGKITLTLDGGRVVRETNEFKWGYVASVSDMNMYLARGWKDMGRVVAASMSNPTLIESGEEEFMMGNY